MQEAVIRRLAGGTPLAWKEMPDGGLVVINARGQKLYFTVADIHAVSVDTYDVGAVSKTAQPMVTAPTTRVDVMPAPRAGVAPTPTKKKGH